MKWIILALIIIALFYSIIFSTKECGGITANLPGYSCPPAYSCIPISKFPKSPGNCIFIPYLKIRGLITVPPIPPPPEKDKDICFCKNSIVIENKCASIHNPLCIDKFNCICE